MNKAQLIEAIAAEVDLPKVVAGRMLDATISQIVKALCSGDQVSLVGFGTFYAKETAGRKGRNPKTGDPLEIPGGVRAGFKAGKGLKDALNAGAAVAATAE